MAMGQRGEKWLARIMGVTQYLTDGIEFIAIGTNDAECTHASCN